MIISQSRVEYPRITSRILRENPLGDAHERRVAVYLPPGHDDQSEQRYPTLYLLASHGSTGPSLLNWRPWDVTIKDQLDALITNGVIGPAIVVLPDMWTRFGSSQYINSVGMGRYEDHLIDEIIPLVDRDYRTLPQREHRGVLGRSSGGFGALTLAMHRPETFGAFACQSGDMYWEYTCIPGVSQMHQQLEKFGGIEGFVRDIPSIRPKGGSFWQLVMTVCWSAAFSPPTDAPAGFELPIDPKTGALNQAIWEHWLTFDPIRTVQEPQFAEALRSMKLAFIDVGQYDEYQLQVGARVLHQTLESLGINHVYEEYPDGHRHTHYRYDASIAQLYGALKP